LGSWISGSNPLTSRWTAVGLIAAGAAAGRLAVRLVAEAVEAVRLALWRVLRGKYEAPNEAPNPELEHLRQTSEGQILEGQILEGQMLEYQTSEGQILEYQTSEGQILEYQTSEGQILEYQTLESQMLEGATKKAFNDASLSDIRTRLETLPLEEVRGIWQTIANEVAVDCFDADCKVDVAKVSTWMELLGNAENFKKEPLCLIPHAELMRSQMYRVCECILNNDAIPPTHAKDWLDHCATIVPGTHGRSILAAMSKGRQTPLRSGEAILASLFTPHRQQSLPTCSMNSLINAEIRNHLARLIAMYAQMLSDPQFTFPSGCAVQQQPMVDSFITVDLQNGKKERDRIFGDVRSGDPTKIARQIAEWRQEGIEYDPTEQYKLRMPVHNMNDVLFAYLFQTSEFGNWRMTGDDYGTAVVYSGHVYSEDESIEVNDSNFLDVMTALKEQAEAQKNQGYQYMRMRTWTTTATIVGGYNHSGHAENIDINALLALDLDTMESGKAYSIGDRNWANGDASQDIPRLAVRKTDGNPPIFEFGTLWGSNFNPSTMIKVEVFRLDIRRLSENYWNSHKPDIA
jgi:hypothetical protein